MVSLQKGVPTSSRGADFSQLPTAPIQDFQVKPSTSHSARVLGQFPPVTAIFSMYAYTLNFTCRQICPEYYCSQIMTHCQMLNRLSITLPIFTQDWVTYKVNPSPFFVMSVTKQCTQVYNLISHSERYYVNCEFLKHPVLHIFSDMP